jgi:hypothetical protein
MAAKERKKILSFFVFSSFAAIILFERSAANAPD